MASRDHLTALPNALHSLLATREITENDYDILLQLEKFVNIIRMIADLRSIDCCSAQNTVVMGVPENIVKAMPTERVHERSRLLQPGEQCRVCLRSYQIGERVRRLPCRHKFHIDCIGK